MRTELSSVWTYEWKYLFPSFWILGAGLSVLGLWTGAFTQPVTAEMKQVALAVWLLVSSYLVWTSHRLCVVALEDHVLLVVRYFRRVSIPVSAMVRVKQTYLCNPPEITIRLGRDTELGRVIVFIPSGPRHYLSKHPITEKLEAMIGQAHASGEHSDSPSS